MHGRIRRSCRGLRLTDRCKRRIGEGSGRVRRFSDLSNSERESWWDSGGPIDPDILNRLRDRGHRVGPLRRSTQRGRPRSETVNSWARNPIYAFGFHAVVNTSKYESRGTNLLATRFSSCAA